MSEWLDRDGYPTEAAELKVKMWDIGGTEDCRRLLDFVRELWRVGYPNFFEEADGVYEISTGGWSGNESLIGAIHENTIFHVFCWRASRRGGHYVYALPGVRVDVDFTVTRGAS